ncbi:aldehyde dehydrogenase family protein [Naumannella sp. ID2617S]|uniref:Aldehyde dehydrogenase n=1 Tax=Enemella dayhoffiae TaxID=2016507 RepID=A0A255GUY5_9ACTN|nr:aldehyde dehydrogenase family protein [Enemella dayhoffiae]NNG20623.1 aldehyde dehydrogenase family protein [Naumannella sp. ID2617S]OYO18606.1 aldehyde dehydrogenase [Enemella dayhoffiae]
MTAGLTVDGTIARARVAQVAVGWLSPEERLAHLSRLRRTIQDRSEEIVDRVQAETGKTRSDILMSEVFGVLDAILWLEGNAAAILADEKVSTPLTLMGKKSRIWYAPRGVALIISPWNYPFFQAVVPIVNAFVAGNAVVYKPSEHTPLPGLLESLLEQAGIAPAWVQVVQGDGEVAERLITQRPDQVMFTGSARTGRAILRQAAELLIPVELELGGKDPMIVFDDVNLDRTVAGAAFGGLTANGQSCTSVERLFVQRGVCEDFVRRLVKLVEGLQQVADPATDRAGDADLGVMTTDFQVATVARHVLDAEQQGARRLTGTDWDAAAAVEGRPGLPDRPYRFVPPMVFVDVPEDSLLASEETFGPVLPVFTFDTEQEVVGRAKDTPYGLTASVWSHDLDRAERVARQLRCGGVSINNVMATEATPALPFGGVGESGMGRYKGAAGLRTFCDAQSVIIDSDGKKLEPNWFPYTGAKYQLFRQMMTAWLDRGPTRLAKFARTGSRLEAYAQKPRGK